MEEFALACRHVPALKSYFPDLRDAQVPVVPVQYFWNVCNTLDPPYVMRVLK